MPLCKKNKQTAGPARNQAKRRQTPSGGSEVKGATTTIPPPKKWRVQPPLTKDNISAIVEAIRALLQDSSSLPPSTTDGVPDRSSSGRRPSPPHDSDTTPGGRNSSTDREQHESGHEGSPVRIDHNE